MLNGFPKLSKLRSEKCGVRMHSALSCFTLCGITFWGLSLAAVKIFRLKFEFVGLCETGKLSQTGWRRSTNTKKNHRTNRLRIHFSVSIPVLLHPERNKKQ